jgi:hypothetical protein
VRCSLQALLETRPRTPGLFAWPQVQNKRRDAAAFFLTFQRIVRTGRRDLERRKIVLCGAFHEAAHEHGMLLRYIFLAET